jgi:ADP-heptose:LPS heptosyltransferase
MRFANISKRNWAALVAGQSITVGAPILKWAAPIRSLRRVFRFQRRHVALADARTILVIRPDEIGDVVLTSPFLRALRSAAPAAHIALVVKTACRELVEECPYVDAVYAFDFSSGSNRRLRLCWNAWNLRRHVLYRRGFDFALLPRRGHDYYDSKFLAHLLAGNGTILAHRDAIVTPASAPARGVSAISYLSNPNIEHEVLHNLRFLRWCGAVEEPPGRLETWLTSEDRQFAESVLIGNRRYVAIAPGAGLESRCWPAERFSALASSLKEAYGLTAVQLGAPGDPSCGLGIDLIGRTTLRQAAAIIERCALFVGNDSGLMHLAAAVTVPVVEISGFRKGGDTAHANSPFRFGPWGVAHRVVQPPTGLAVLAIQEVSVENVGGACAALLSHYQLNK